MPLEKRAGSKFWQIRFEINGHRVRQSSGTTSRREAAAKERELRAYYEKQPPAAGRVLGAALADLGGLDVERAAGGGCTDKQLSAIEYAWAAICRFWGPDAPVTVITYDAVEQYLHHRRTVDEVSGQTARKERQALRRMAELAHRRGWLPALPQTWPKVRSDPPKVAQAGKLHPAPMLRRWFRELRRINRTAYLESRLAVLTGLRAAELGRIRPSWVRHTPSGPVLIVPAASAKSRKERTVGLSREAAAIIANLARPDDRPVIGKRHFRKARERARVRIGYGRVITLRDLRHTYGTLSLQQTGDAVGVQSSMGHTDLRMTSRYQHSTLERAVAAAVAVEQTLNQNRHMKTATVPGNAKSGGRRGDRTPDILLVRVGAERLEHLITCNHCARMATEIVDHHLEHGETATVTRHSPDRKKVG